MTELKTENGSSWANASVHPLSGELFVLYTARGLRRPANCRMSGARHSADLSRWQRACSLERGRLASPRSRNDCSGQRRASTQTSMLLRTQSTTTVNDGW